MKKKIFVTVATMMAIASVTACSNKPAAKETTVAESVAETVVEDSTLQIASDSDIESEAETETDALDSSSDSLLGMPNPLSEFDTLEDAESAVGFEVSLPDGIDGYDNISYVTIGDTVLQVTYESEDNQIQIRKGVSTDGIEDISGDYNQYLEIVDAMYGAKAVTEEREADGTRKITWSDGEYQFAVTSEEGMGEDLVSTLIAAIA